MPQWLIELMGWVPGIVFPGAAIMQLREVLCAESTAGVSGVAWAMCAIANFCLYAYTEKYVEPQAMLLLLSGAIQCAIVVMLYRRRAQE